MNNLIKLNIFTCCNNIYKDFIPLFILSNITYNEDCFVEVGVDDDNYDGIKESLDVLKTIFGNKFLVYNVNFNNKIYNGKEYMIKSNTVRFLTTPKIKSEFVYISDVDIITLEKNIMLTHVNHMEKFNLPYSNVVRGDLEKLTGLHFTPYENYYPIPNFNDLYEKNLLIQDEKFLYQIVKKRYPNFNMENQFRPVHGIHISPNRPPFASEKNPFNWGIGKWYNEWVNFRNSEHFLMLEPTLTDYIKEKIKIIDNYSK